ETEFSPPIRQNLNIVQALRGNLQIWKSDSASEGEKAVAFCWILHLAGDLHQPLHTVALFSKEFFPKGDRGGNSIQVVWGGETKNLHAVWDGLPTNLESLEPSARTIRSINEDVVDDAAIDEWLSHHANLARKFVYTDELKSQLLGGLKNDELPEIVLSRNYLVAAESIARRQVNLAGYRIAKLVE
ncbi:MAG: S1/P1 nuclease, partial [Gammaproteobacteria bacterium]|nr:S1/P1 nuclease [Gammaproteobacteria bacterium]